MLFYVYILNYIYYFRYKGNYSFPSHIWTKLYEHACIEAKGQPIWTIKCSLRDFIESFTLTGSWWVTPLLQHYLLNFLLWLPSQNLDLLCSAHGIGLCSSMGYELDQTPHLYFQLLRKTESLRCAPYIIYWALRIIHTTVQMFGVGKFYNLFKKVSYAHQGCIYLIKNTVILWNIITI